MNKKQGILIGIALILLFAGIALATSPASPGVVIYAFYTSSPSTTLSPTPTSISGFELLFYNRGIGCNILNYAKEIGAIKPK